MGSMTGRGAGYCAGYDTPGFAYPAPGRGAGMGLGMGGGFRGRRFAGGGRGWQHGFRWEAAGASQPEAATEKQWLQRETQGLQSELDAIKDRLTELENQSGEK